MASPPPHADVFQTKEHKNIFSCLTQTILYLTQTTQKSQKLSCSFFLSHTEYSANVESHTMVSPPPLADVFQTEEHKNIFLPHADFFTSHADDAEIAETLALFFLVSHGNHRMHRIYSPCSLPPHLVFIRTRISRISRIKVRLYQPTHNVFFAYRIRIFTNYHAERKTGWHSCYSDAMSKDISRRLFVSFVKFVFSKIIRPEWRPQSGETQIFFQTEEHKNIFLPHADFLHLTQTTQKSQKQSRSFFLSHTEITEHTDFYSLCSFPPPHGARRSDSPFCAFRDFRVKQ